MPDVFRHPPAGTSRMEWSGGFAGFRTASL